MDAALTPREIQARIRAGQSVDELVAISGMPIQRIEAFAGPVLAERAWMAVQASHGQVRREGYSTHQSLLELIGDRLASRGRSSADVVWDAWRGNDRLWTLRASYQASETPYEAVFRYDPVGRFSVAINDEARWLIGEAVSVADLQPVRHNRDSDTPVDIEPTIDLSQTRRVRPGEHPADLFEFEPRSFAPVSLTEVDGIYDLLPNQEHGAQTTDGIDELYGLMAGLTEDSVRIYDGLVPSNATPAQTRRTTSRPAKASPTNVDQPNQDEGKEPTVRVPRSKKRVKVPTWDEIMFGSPQVDR